MDPNHSINIIISNGVGQWEQPKELKLGDLFYEMHCKDSDWFPIINVQWKSENGIRD